MMASGYGVPLIAVWDCAVRHQLPFAYHGGFHMTEWPWWPGPMHIAYPLLFLAVIIAVIYLFWRGR